MKSLSIFVLLIIPLFCLGQSDEEMIKKIYDRALTKGQSYEMLEYLSKNIGHRLSGSPQAAAAVEWSRQQMIQFDFDTVYLQEVMVPHWVRGNTELARLIDTNTGPQDLTIYALGNSVGTGPDGILANVIEVHSFEELEKLGNTVKGKIVFFNRPMDATHIHTFRAYGGAVDQRVDGASRAAKQGAIGVIVRSMASNIDDIPHTGTLVYDENIKKIPAVAVSTLDAEALSKGLKKNPNAKLYIETHCKMLPDVLSYNVIGEIKGSTIPEEIIVAGGHLDSWDVGDGSHDDGAGCVQSIEVLRLLKELGYRPKRTLRAVMFMNEENGLRGGLKYAEMATKNSENHIAALESDSGGFSPRGFRSSGTAEQKEKLSSWKKLLLPYGLHDLESTGGGADIGPLAAHGTFLIGLFPDSQRYFNYHHTKADTFDKVDKRELELGAAAMTALIYLIDNYGI